MSRQDLDVATWLRDLGLERYAQAFLDAEVTSEALPELTDADLRELGLPLGPRKVVLKAIRELAGALASKVPWVEAGPDLAPVPAEAERRQLTVMFVDLVGSTALSGKLDPEEMHQVIRSYQNAVAGEVARFEGHVAKFMGDGVLAYFGWPRAHEDEAERAVRAGLAITGAVPTLATPAGEALAARIGIATGLVMVGDLVGEGGAREETVVGETPNLAARLQALADPGGVVVSDTTRRLVGGLFEFEDLGRHQLKGIEAPVQAFVVAGEQTVEDRFAARQSGVPLSLVGRDQELALLLDRWRLARGGEGQVVLLCGEPGIGKSRIVLALRERLRAEPRTSVRYNCSPFHTNSALHPAIEQLTRAAGFAAGDDAATRLVKLEALAAQATAPDEVLPYLIDLLGLPPDGHRPLPPLTPQERKARTFRALLAQLEGLARRSAVLLVLEDAHWCDPTTLELFDRTVERVASLPVLLVVTHRPGFSPHWAGHAHVTSLTLSRLGRAEAGAIVAEAVGGRALPADVLETIVARTDGVPLFVEELTKAVLEAGLLRPEGDRYVLQGPLPLLAIPDTLHGSLMARLDRLAPVKEVAQVGAVIGREFSGSLLAAVARMDQRGLADALDQLVGAGLIFRRGSPTEPFYVFKHALVQDAAYQSLLKSRRQQLHARVAEALEAGRAGGEDGPPPEILAHHLTEAGLLAQALLAWLAAGERAWRRSTYLEAIAHLRRGLEVAAGVPGPEGRRAEIRLHNLLGAALLAARGPRPEVTEAYERAGRLAEEAGEAGELLRALWGSWFYHNLRADIPRARSIASDLLARAGGIGDGGLVLQARHAAWTTGWQAGDLPGARNHAEAGLQLYDEARHHELTAFYGGHDSGVCCRNTLGVTLWLLGSPDQAVDRSEQGVALARKLAHPFTLAVSLVLSSWVRFFRGDRAEAGLLSCELVELCAGQGIPVYLASGRILEGALRVADGEDAVGLILTNVRALEELGATARRSFHLGLLAEAHLRAGRPGEACAALEEALRFAAEKGEHWYEPELHRLRGELALAAGGERDEARAAFEAACTTARERGACSFELRAAIRLAHLDGEDGERQRARDLLAPVYGRFTEGFGTPDLNDAKKLLDVL